MEQFPSMSSESSPLSKKRYMARRRKQCHSFSRHYLWPKYGLVDEHAPFYPSHKPFCIVVAYWAKERKSGIDPSSMILQGKGERETTLSPAEKV